MFLCVLLILFFFFRVFLFKGDEVIEWNGRSLQGKSTQEVCDVIEESRHESQIELIVSRPLSVNRKAAQTSWRQSHSPIRAQTRQYLHKGSTHLILIKTSFFELSHDNKLIFWLANRRNVHSVSAFLRHDTTENYEILKKKVERTENGEQQIVLFFCILRDFEYTHTNPHHTNWTSASTQTAFLQKTKH